MQYSYSGPLSDTLKAKISLHRMPEINKLRFYASNMLTWQKYAKQRYESQVKKVIGIRELLRKELEL